MATSPNPLALKASLALALLEQPGALDKHTRKQLEQHIVHMIRVAQESTAAQDAVSFIYGYSLWKTDATLTAAELIKAMRSPLFALPELDELDAALRKHYLEQMQDIATRGAQKIMDTMEP
ncbi:MAG: hypothetical protein H3C34_19055 [Caldilineaceae bacterium]|nr:hypothetical protein [Caldilineaceae bacterium]